MTDNLPITGFRARIPNILTIGRIATIPILVAGIITMCLYGPVESWVKYGTLALFMLAGVTDYLDGYWARKWNVTSDFGRMIDPIADKLLVAACLIALCIGMSGHWIIVIPSLAIIGRDILVSGAREHAALKSRAMPPTNLAKWKTACEMLAIAILIFYFVKSSLGAQIGPETIKMAGLGFLWLAAILSVYTGSLYFRAALKD